MKKKILACSLLLVLMGILPFLAVKCTDRQDISNNKLTSSAKVKEYVKNSEANDPVIGLTYKLCKKNYTDETIKAVATLINTDYIANPSYFDLSDKTVYLSKKDIDNSELELYSRVESIVNSNSLNILKADNKIVFIPYSSASAGYTLDSDECESITSVASPWDCFSENYDENSECVGVSINGINYLCENGADAEQALKWYLPEFKETPNKAD